MIIYPAASASHLHSAFLRANIGWDTERFVDQHHSLNQTLGDEDMRLLWSGCSWSWSIPYAGLTMWPVTPEQILTTDQRHTWHMNKTFSPDNSQQDMMWPTTVSTSDIVQLSKILKNGNVKYYLNNFYLIKILPRVISLIWLVGWRYLWINTGCLKIIGPCSFQLCFEIWVFLGQVGKLMKHSRLQAST